MLPVDKNTFAPVPPMGWNSYDYYDTTVNEHQVKANADYMAANLKQFGWEYIVVDIQWYAHNAGSMRDKFQYIPFSTLEMDEYSRLMPDPVRFPSAANGAGFQPLADYVHSLGLKFGIHIMRGIPRIAAHHHAPIFNSNATADQVADPTSICGWNPDMYGVRNTPEGQAYYDSIIELYASWGVDFIKCDDICNTSLYRENQYSAAHEIEMLHRAIMKCGRPIVLSLSPGPALIDKAWHYQQNANMWRITDDFWDNWTQLEDMFHRCELWQNEVAEGCYPDCDMLAMGKVGKGFCNEHDSHFTFDEQKTMMSLWCLFGSPLMLGAELTMLDEKTLSLLTNRDILEMLPPSCKPRQLLLTKSAAVWVGYHRETNQAYLALFNLTDVCSDVSVCKQALEDALSFCGMKTSLPASFPMKELWTGDHTEFTAESFSASVAAHGCCVYRFSV